jgi:hypothetical protein
VATTGEQPVSVMVKFKTENGERFGQPEIVLILDDEAQMEPRWILDYFQDSVAAGKRFRVGETVQIGWMVAKLFETADGELEVWEPRFQSVPIQWVRGINNTLRHLILQKSVAELFQKEPVFPSVLQAGIVVSPVWEQQGQLCMLREEPMQNDSGWRFSRDESERPGGQFRSLFEIGCRFPLLIPFLALPPGGSVICAQDLSVKYRGTIISSRDSELLKRILNLEAIWN